MWVCVCGGGGTPLEPLGSTISMGLLSACPNCLLQIRQRMWVRNGQQLLRLEAFYSSPYWWVVVGAGGWSGLMWSM